MSFNRSGYIGRAPGDSSVTIARKTYEPTGVQTDFTFSAGYDPGYCDVYLNGIRLVKDNDFTASDGSTVGLTSEANAGDIVEIVAYKAFNLGVPISDITGNLDVSGSVSASSSITAGTFYGSGSGLTGVATTDYIITGTAATFNSQVKVLNLNVTGITSTTSFNVGAATTIDGGGINVTGVITATSFSGSGANLTSLPAGTTITVADESSDTTCFPSFFTAATGDLAPKTGTNLTFNSSSGALTATSVAGNIVGGTGSFSGAVNVDDTTDSTSSTSGALIVDGGLGVAKNVYIGAGLSVAGTLTYEDVTSVDSVGLITAKSGVNITGGQLTVGSGITFGSAGVATFSGTGDVHLLDNVRLNVGDGSDLAIYHDGSDSRITNSTGALQITGNNDFRIKTNGGQNIFKATGNLVELYYDTGSGGSNKKFETTNDGTVTTGIGTFTAGLEINADNKKLKFGVGDDLNIYSTGTNGWVYTPQSGADLYMGTNAGEVYIQTGSGGNDTAIKVNSGGSVELNHSTNKKFETTNDGVKITGIATCSNGLDTVGMLRESYNTVANKLSAAPNIDIEQGMVHYFTTTETTTATPNIRYSSSKSLNNVTSDGDALTVTIITKAAAAGYSANWTIDGSAVTEEWVGGAAPSAGGSDGYDIYTANLLKTGSGSWIVFINLVNAT